MKKIKSFLNQIMSFIKNKWIKLLIFSGILIFFFLTLGFVYFLIMNSPVKMSKDKVMFRIEKGTHLKQLSSELKKQGLIKSKFFFYAAARIKKLNKKLIPGYYHIKNGMSSFDIINVFANKDYIKVKVLIPEGLTNLEIAHRLEKKGLCTKQEFLNATADEKFLKKIGINALTAEGYLFPATYSFPYGATPKQIISKMVKNFKTVISSLDKVKSGLSLHETIILASLIEGETFVKQERAKIAGVYLKRLKIGKKLQACITVKYIKMPEIINFRKKIKKLKQKLNKTENENEKIRIEREIKIWNKRATVITYRDLERQSRFNTYINPGLPPGPVCNPGLASIKAAFYPDKTDYKFFFWHPRKQRHIFSRSYNEHLNRLKKMRRRLRISN